MGYQREGALFRKPTGEIVTPHGYPADEIECERCLDARFINVRPWMRQSRGPWDWELILCPCSEPVSA